MDLESVVHDVRGEEDLGASSSHDRKQVSVAEVTTPAEREAVYSLRYRVYVEHMKRKQVWADHERRRIEEPLDLTGCVLGAFDGGRLVGTGRVNTTGNTTFERPEIWGIDGFERMFPGRVSLGTKLMVEPGLRSGMFFFRICREMVRVARDSGAGVLLLDCNDPVRGLFERLGFIPYMRTSTPEYGEVTAMLMFFESADYLKRMKSPLYSVAHRPESAKTNNA
jgi:hypothetical protein